MSIPEYAQQTIATLYPSEPTNEGLIPAHEAELAYQLFSELGTVPEFTSFAFTCREQLLTGISDFTESNLPDPAALDFEQLRKVQESFVRYILTSGTKGFKDGIDEIQFESNPLAGRFIDRRGDSDRVFSYEISNELGAWTSTVRAVSGVSEDPTFSEVAKPEEVMTLKFSESMSNDRFKQIVTATIREAFEDDAVLTSDVEPVGDGNGWKCTYKSGKQEFTLEWDGTEFTKAPVIGGDFAEPVEADGDLLDDDEYDRLSEISAADYLKTANAIVE